MRQGTYLNVILTINAALLTGLIWTQVADRPAVSAAEASAMQDSPLSAGAQRAKMMESLNEIKRETEQTRKLLESGNAKVRVTNLHEIRTESASAN